MSINSISILYSIVFGGCIFSIGCASPQSPREKIRERINEFYVQTAVKDYQPKGEDEIDTIQVIEGVRTTLQVRHSFAARSKSDILEEYVDTFDVTVFDHAIVAIPRGY